MKSVLWSVISYFSAGLVVLALLSCSAPDRLTVDDTSLSSSARLISEKRLANAQLFPPSTHQHQLPPRRHVISIYHHPLSFDSPSFLSALDRRYLTEAGVTQTQENSASHLISAQHPKMLSTSQALARDFLNSAWQSLSLHIDRMSVRLSELNLQLGSFADIQAAPPAELSPEFSQSLHADNRSFTLITSPLPLSEVIEFVAVGTGYQIRNYHHSDDERQISSMSISGSPLQLMRRLAEQSGLRLARLSPSSSGRDEIVFISADRLAEAGQASLHYHRLQDEGARLKTDIAQTSAAYHHLKQAQTHLSRLTEQKLVTGDEIVTELFLGPVPAPALPALLELQSAFSDLKQALSELKAQYSQAGIQTKSAAQMRALWAGSLAVSDCISVGDEVFVETISLYHRTAEEITEAVSPLFPNDSSEDTEQAVCPTSTLISDRLVMRPHQASVIVSGAYADVELAVKLIEEFDQPKLQVLVEIFMVTVSREFSRQLENIITRASDPGAGGNDITEAELLRSISSAVTGGYTVNLATATNQIESALSFIESQQLGRVLSSPTILVQDGTSEARIRRQTTAEVLFTQNIFDDNSSRVIGTQEVNTQLEAPLELLLRDISVSPANRTVQMTVRITNREFLSALSQITKQEDADFTEDVIETVFTASPGDVIVLAGLTANKDSTSTTGLPGTTGSGTALSSLLGGSDVRTNQSNEMVVFLAPTVIDPSVIAASSASDQNDSSEAGETQ